MATSWRSLGVSAPLEIIRFAAANRLCVELDYQNERGQRDIRIIEPYSLRRSQEGKYLLMAVKAQTDQVRSYRVDRILNAKLTQQMFKPRYSIELTDGGMLSAPIRARTNAVSLPVRRKAFVNAPLHEYRCPLCSKTFKRKDFDSKLNPHKNTMGFACSGRIGVFVK